VSGRQIHLYALHHAHPQPHLPRDLPNTLVSFAQGLTNRWFNRSSTLGLPSRIPFALALANPALIRSRMIDRSNSAKTPET